MSSSIASFAFEVVPELSLLVTYQGPRSPSDEEWEGFLRTLEELHRLPNVYRYLTISEGGHPSSAQQAKLKAVTLGRTPQVAIVASSIAVRFVVSVLALMNPRVQCFRPDQRAETYAHIGLGPGEIAEAEAAVARLRVKVSGAARAA